MGRRRRRSIDANESCVSEGWKWAAASNGRLDGEKNPCIPLWPFVATAAPRTLFGAGLDAALEALGALDPPPDIADVVGRIIVGFVGRLLSACEWLL